MSTDPLMELFPVQSPYSYANNSPLIWKDPSGLAGETEFEASEATTSFGIGVQYFLDVRYEWQLIEEESSLQTAGPHTSTTPKYKAIAHYFWNRRGGGGGGGFGSSSATAMVVKPGSNGNASGPADMAVGDGTTNVGRGGQDIPSNTSPRLTFNPDYMNDKKYLLSKEEIQEEFKIAWLKLPDWLKNGLNSINLDYNVTSIKNFCIGFDGKPAAAVANYDSRYIKFAPICMYADKGRDWRPMGYISQDNDLVDLPFEDILFHEGMHIFLYANSPGYHLLSDEDKERVVIFFLNEQRKIWGRKDELEKMP